MVREIIPESRATSVGIRNDTYPVPVEIRKGLDEAEVLRLATVENVQREQLHPMDEAEAFAKLLQAGGTIEAIVEKMGLSLQTVKRRLALASLCDEAKQALREGTITRSVAEALTLGSHARQRTVLQSFRYDEVPDADDIREMLTDDAPSLSIAIFPHEQYQGAVATDLFADNETSYFEDVDQFMRLQETAVAELAEKHRETAAWVDTLNVYGVPWWQYRQAEDGEPSGVVINLHPSGAVEVREGLARHKFEPRVVEATQETPVAPRMREKRPPVNTALLEYVACQKSAALQAALLADLRKAKEVAALMLLLRLDTVPGARFSTHRCHFVPKAQREQRSFRVIEKAASDVANRLGLPPTQDGRIVERLLGTTSALNLLVSITCLSDEELDQLLVLVPILCFGHDEAIRFNDDDHLMGFLAKRLSFSMREWWMPDAVFLGTMRRDDLLPAAIESSAAEHIQGLHRRSKGDLVEVIAEYFTKNVGDPEGDERAKQWLPDVMRIRAQDLSDAAQ